MAVLILRLELLELLAASWLALGHSQEDSLTNLILITVFFNYFNLKVDGSLKTRLGP